MKGASGMKTNSEPEKYGSEKQDTEFFHVRADHFSLFDISMVDQLKLHRGILYMCEDGHGSMKESREKNVQSHFLGKQEIKELIM